MNLEFLHSKKLIDYSEAYDFMKQRQLAIIDSGASSLVWFLDHLEVITAGRRADSSELLQSAIPDSTKHAKVYEIERGGKYTYHNPGQRIVYFMVDLKQLHNNKPDIRKFIRNIESAIIDCLKCYGIEAATDLDNIGIWVKRDNDIYKIASIGLSVKKWVTMHGIAINVNNDLEGFNQIVPCGINNCKMTSIQKLIGKPVDMEQFDMILKDQLQKYVFIGV